MQRSAVSPAGHGRSLLNARRALLLGASILTLSVCATPNLALADEAAPPAAAPADLAEVVVNGIPYKETVLPTRLSSSSALGLDLNVMDTPRNTTLLSTTQLETLNIKDPRAFSYLTASSYSDSSFGTPNIPRIRGQYADVFFNGMRSSLTENGYGVPPNFDDFDNISITKGPASVIDGPGAGVGGEVDFITKVAKLNKSSTTVAASLDSVSNRRLSIDSSMVITPGVLAVRIDYAGENSGSYFPSHNSVINSVYANVHWRPNDNYEANFNAEVEIGAYTENVGVNRVTQALINSGLYTQGVPIGTPTVPGNPYSLVQSFGTQVLLTTTVPLSIKTTIDQAPGTTTNGNKFMAQYVQTYFFNDKISVENNTFWNYQDSENQEAYYYADASRGSYSIENRTLVKDKSALPFGFFGAKSTPNEAVLGATVRFAHVNYISNYNNETPAVFDLTGNPKTWIYPVGNLTPDQTDSYFYKSAFGHTLSGTPGRDFVNGGNTGVSNLIDVGIFFQDRMEISPELSVLFGTRLDAEKVRAHDPFPCIEAPFTCVTSLPASHSTGTYGLGNANFSTVYRPQSWVSGYLTFDFNQSPAPNGGEGGINAYGQVPDHNLMRSTSYLYEAGLKFNLLDNKLFASTAVFDQKRSVPIGNGGTELSRANIRGVEIELNYQPTRNFFATASYSYIETTLSQAAGFYNFPAYSGVQYPGMPYNFIDGAGTGVVWAGHQKFTDPGVPDHVFNVLGNYKFENGFGIRSGVQVTGPISTSQSGQIDLAASSNIPQAIIKNGGFFKSPVIPWQYTWNASVFYEWDRYTATLSVYNLTDQKNWQSSPNFYGNDFLVRNDPRTFEVRVTAKY